MFKECTSGRTKKHQRVKVGRGKLVMNNANSQPIDHKKIMRPQVIANISDTAVENLESDDEFEGSPSSKIKNSFAHINTSMNRNKLEEESVGYLGKGYNFVVPDLDLSSDDDNKKSTFDPLNLFKAFGKQESTDSKSHNRRYALNIISKIAHHELSKYEDDPFMKFTVSKILN